MRLKQLLFNSLLCAYYVGFIPMQFADVSALHESHTQYTPHAHTHHALTLSHMHTHEHTSCTYTHMYTHTHAHTYTTHTHTHTDMYTSNILPCSPFTCTQSHLYYDRWWCVEHAFLVWANSFVFLSTHLLPPSYCQLLHQCALHLGCWTRCIHDENASM